MVKYSNSKNPGPGHYNSESYLNKSGRCLLSNIPNCAGIKMVNGKDYDFQKNKIVPGPGTYQNK
jgi:hypothetical protein